MRLYDGNKRIEGFAGILAGAGGAEMEATLLGRMACLDREVEPDAPTWVLEWEDGIHPNHAGMEWALSRTRRDGGLQYSLWLDGRPVAEASTAGGGTLVLPAHFEPEHADELLSLLYNLEATIPNELSSRTSRVELHYGERE